MNSVLCVLNRMLKRVFRRDEWMQCAIHLCGREHEICKHAEKHVVKCVSIHTIHIPFTECRCLCHWNNRPSDSLVFFFILCKCKWPHETMELKIAERKDLQNKIELACALIVCFHCTISTLESDSISPFRQNTHTARVLFQYRSKKMCVYVRLFSSVQLDQIGFCDFNLVLFPLRLVYLCRAVASAVFVVAH